MATQSSRGFPPQFLVDEQWLSQVNEEVIDAEIPILDPHHHLWLRPHSRYLLEEFLADANSGHRLIATVFSECASMYRRDGDPAFASVGEVEFANGVAAMSASGVYGPTRVCQGIVARADLCAGDLVSRVLGRLFAAAPERLKGIRQLVAWDPNPEINTLRSPPPPGVLSSAAFRAGFKQLANFGLSFDVGVYHSQLREVAELADAFPGSSLVVNHLGGWVGVGPYGKDKLRTFERWHAEVRELAKRDNVTMKLGGIGMRSGGFDFLDRDRPPTSRELADAWRPHVDACIDAFGATRCMFESNFPVDKPSFSYRTLWNCFKRLAVPYSTSDRNALLCGTANRVYRLGLDL